MTGVGGGWEGVETLLLMAEPDGILSRTDGRTEVQTHNREPMG